MEDVSMKSALAVFAITASAFALPAAAQVDKSAFYLGAGVGQSKAKDWCTGAGGFSCDDKKTAWKAFGGYQFNRYLSAELGYANLGKFTASGFGLTDEAKVTAWDLSAIGERSHAVTLASSVRPNPLAVNFPRFA